MKLNTGTVVTEKELLFTSNDVIICMLIYIAISPNESEEISKYGDFFFKLCSQY